MSQRMAMHELNRAVDFQIKDGGIYLGTIDWFHPKFQTNPKGSLYIYVDTYRENGFVKTFQIKDQLDISVAKRWENFTEKGKTIRIPVFDTGDVVQFVARIDRSTGYQARNVLYVGLGSDLTIKRRLHDQEWDLKLGHHSNGGTGSPLPPLKLRSRPR